MSEHINTLKYFDDLRKNGMAEDQARIYVMSLNEAFDGIATKKDLDQGLESLKKDLKIFFGYIIIGFIVIDVIWPIISKKWGI